MRLDKTRFAIRERAMPEILDLAILVTRRHALGLAAALVLGALPFAAMNHVVLSSMFEAQAFSDNTEIERPEDLAYMFFWVSLILIGFETPLATALLTLYLGQSMFSERPSLSRAAGELRRVAPQLFLYQFLLRGVTFAMLPLSPLWYIAWPYANEVILLEHNPWRSRGGRMGTFKRINSLHGRSGVSLFGRWAFSLAVGLCMTFGLWQGLLFARGMLASVWTYDRAAYTLYWSASAWLVIGFFAVARYLCYLDLRIRSEGWEVDLALRAEADKLSRTLVGV